MVYSLAHAQLLYSLCSFAQNSNSQDYYILFTSMVLSTASPFLLDLSNLVPRPSLAPVLDCLQSNCICSQTFWQWTWKIGVNSWTTCSPEWLMTKIMYSSARKTPSLFQSACYKQSCPPFVQCFRFSPYDKAVSEHSLWPQKLLILTSSCSGTVFILAW